MKENLFDKAIREKVHKEYAYDSSAWEAASTQLDKELGKPVVIGKWVYYLSSVVIIALLAYLFIPTQGVKNSNEREKTYSYTSVLYTLNTIPVQDASLVSFTHKEAKSRSKKENRKEKEKTGAFHASTSKSSQSRNNPHAVSSNDLQVTKSKNSQGNGAKAANSLGNKRNAFAGKEQMELPKRSLNSNTKITEKKKLLSQKDKLQQKTSLHINRLVHDKKWSWNVWEKGISLWSLNSKFPSFGGVVVPDIEGTFGVNAPKKIMPFIEVSHFQGLRNKHNLLMTNTPELSDYRNTAETARMVRKSQVLIGANKGQLYLGLGIGLTQYSAKVNYQKNETIRELEGVRITREVLNYAFEKDGKTVILIQEQRDSSFGTKNVISQAFSGNASLNYIHIPFRLSYELLPQKRSSLGLAVGGSLLVNPTTKGYDDAHLLFQNQESVQDGLKRLAFDVHFSARYGYYLNRNWMLYGELSALMNPSSLATSYDWMMSSTGLNIGLRFKI